MYRRMTSVRYLLAICLLLSVTICSSKQVKYTKKPKPPKPPMKPMTTTEMPCESTSESYAVMSTNPATDGWMPYSYSYTASVGSYGDNGMIAAAQSGDSDGVVTGSYSLEADDGQMRQVIYKADKSGFHATVKTNEQGTANEDPADVHIISTYDGSSGSQPTEGYEYYTTEAAGTSTQDYYAETTEMTTKPMCACKMTTTAAPVTKYPTKKCRCYTKKVMTTMMPMKTKAPYKRPKPKVTTKAPYKKKTTKAMMKKTTTKKPNYGYY